MNEAQTLLAIENLMKSVIQRTYCWRDFKSDYADLMNEARAIYSSYRDYAPMIQAYFDLLPERIRCRDEDVFCNKTIFQEFQSELKDAQKEFTQGFKRNNQRNQRNLEQYFEDLLGLHCKLLLVRVDLHYSSENHPSMKQFSEDVERFLSRVQNKDTLFKDQVGYAYRLEQGGKSRGYHCHLLIIYNGSVRCKDSYLGQAIGELWQNDITRRDGQFYNCNQSEHKHSLKREKRLGIGMIRREDQSSVNNARAAISYLARPEKDDQYLRGKLPRMREFCKGQLKKEQHKYKSSQSQEIIDIHHLHEQ
ncbi:inovirus-type Gp2 protein [Acinetobacter sp. ANC 4178]|uniref:inovirus-type Gp2 protein n=1 Tax=Acinetobacter sp. ANC 4178 TaxID=2529839 RepID=UPI00103BEF47|nr:inovirus-type Gp2 protein [Acinetobacter sp. ANC 4178]TCB65516.1 inovirus Gp2 family protein [Acinetobacter sp. ANC 4178]